MKISKPLIEKLSQFLDSSGQESHSVIADFQSTFNHHIHYNLKRCLNDKTAEPDFWAIEQIADFVGLDMDAYKQAFHTCRTEWASIPHIENPFDSLSNHHLAWELLMLLALPHISVTNPKLIPYFQTTEKLNAKIETPIKFGRFLSSVAGLAESELNPYLDKFRVLTDANLLHFAENDDLQTWETVYRSPNIVSCMNNSDYGLTTFDTFKCYPSAAHGLPSNGLRLAYLVDSHDKVIARCIVHEPSKTFVRVYGDSVLKELLLRHGYTQDNRVWHNGEIFLYTEPHPTEGWLVPYLDASSNVAHETLDGKDILRATDSGCLPCRNISGSTENGLYDDGEYPEECRCELCGDYCTSGSDVVYHVLHGGARLIDWVCEHCCDAETHLAHYHGEEVRCVDGDSIEVADDRYINTPDNLDYYDIVYSDYHDEYLFLDDVVYSEYDNGYIREDEAVPLYGGDDYALESSCTPIGEHFFPEDWLETAENVFDVIYLPSSEAPNHVTQELLLKLQDLTEEDLDQQRKSYTERLESEIQRSGLKIGDEGTSAIDAHQSQLTIQAFSLSGTEKHFKLMIHALSDGYYKSPFSADFFRLGPLLQQHDFKVGDVVYYANTRQIYKVESLSAKNPNLVQLYGLDGHEVWASNLKSYDKDLLPLPIGTLLRQTNRCGCRVSEIMSYLTPSYAKISELVHQSSSDGHSIRPSLVPCGLDPTDETYKTWFEVVEPETGSLNIGDRVQPLLPDFPEATVSGYHDDGHYLIQTGESPNTATKVERRFLIRI